MRRFLVDHGPAGPTLVDDTPTPWKVLGWAGPFTFLGSRQCVTCADWELSLLLEVARAMGGSLTLGERLPVTHYHHTALGMPPRDRA